MAELATRKLDEVDVRCRSRGSERIEPVKKVESKLLEWTMLLSREMVALIEKAGRFEKTERTECRR